MTDKDRIKLLDWQVEHAKAGLTPHEPAQWERDAEVRRERDDLRMRVAELELQLDQLVDSMTASELKNTPAYKPTRGRPPGARDSKPRRRK
jgi:hypothetical protein